MPAVLEAEQDVSATVAANLPTVAPAKRSPWLKPYHFKAGEANISHHHPKAHRQLGSKNAETVYLESLPVKAKQWVKSTAPAVLIDARKIRCRW